MRKQDRIAHEKQNRPQEQIRSSRRLSRRTDEFEAAHPRQRGRRDSLGSFDAYAVFCFLL